MHTLDCLGSFTSVFNSEHKDLNLLVYMILWDSLGQGNSKPFSEVALGRLWDKGVFKAALNQSEQKLEFVSWEITSVRKKNTVHTRPKNCPIIY